MTRTGEMKGLIELGWFGELPNEGDAHMDTKASAHTPGPWECTDAHVIRGPKNVVIAKTLDSKEDYDTKLSNAHLIAAAPELLGALEGIAGMVVTDDTDFKQLSALCVGIARVAIAKAKGAAA